MSRNNHSKTRRNQTVAAQRTSSGQRTSAVQKRASTKTSSGAMPSSMSGTEPSEPMSIEAARSTAMSLAGNALQSIKSHPMQYALAGLGIACAGAGITWLLVSAGKQSAVGPNGESIDFPHRLQASMRDLQSSVQSSVKGATSSLQSSVKGATSSMKGATTKVSQLASGAVQSGKRFEQSVEDVVREHPVAVGAALLAAGAAIALAIPRSTLEDTWLGRERDQVVSSAQKLAKGAMQKAESFAKQVTKVASNGTANAHS